MFAFVVIVRIERLPWGRLHRCVISFAGVCVYADMGGRDHRGKVASVQPNPPWRERYLSQGVGKR